MGLFVKYTFRQTLIFSKMRWASWSSAITRKYGFVQNPFFCTPSLSTLPPPSPPDPVSSRKKYKFYHCDEQPYMFKTTWGWPLNSTDVYVLNNSQEHDTPMLSEDSCIIMTALLIWPALLSTSYFFYLNLRRRNGVKETIWCNPNLFPEHCFGHSCNGHYMQKWIFRGAHKKNQYFQQRPTDKISKFPTFGNIHNSPTMMLV